MNEKIKRQLADHIRERGLDDALTHFPMWKLDQDTYEMVIHLKAMRDRLLAHLGLL